MNFRDLLDKNLIEPYKASADQIEKEIKLALRDVEAAKKNLEFDYDWALAEEFVAVISKQLKI